ncbi:hypothetical protein AYL99_10112 [Fonsecaea erecta]|uniref:Uncharacterized protein n=1 Tax=Fonsecaea erecta TaxID=1367422 RepID=A0A178Z842_9EURO|nr:hypothetical protein AYL99_10112 [Fonsecaea erecta]OAP55960.1 hypothetical protein AYL99_10112 [Fonsecaea erecta]
MGCGSSSLKGVDIPDVNNQPTSVTQQPQIRKIRTNFSDINYDQNAQQRRLTEYAPHEQPPRVREESRDFTVEQSSWEEYQQYDSRPDRQTRDTGGSFSNAHDRTMSGGSALGKDNDATLQPYQTIDGGGDWDHHDDQSRRQSSYSRGPQNGQDPTSDLSKNEFAAANDPANPNNQDNSQQSPQKSTHSQQQPDGHHRNKNDDDANANTSPISYNTNSPTAANPDIHGDDGGEHKKSWLGQKYASFQSSKRGSGLSDEDIMKYTGKDRSELNEWAQNRPGVGGNQDAGRVGSDSGLAAGAPWN